MRKDNSKNNSDEKAPFFEWIAAGIGLILVCGSIGFILYRAVTVENTPPQLVVSVNSVTQVGTDYLVKFRLKNKGETTAAGVTVIGELNNAGENLETSSVTIDYAPPNSEREGGLFFTTNPQQHELKMRAEGYANP